MNNKEMVAWGYSKILQICFANKKDIPFSFCIDAGQKSKKTFLPIVSPQDFFAKNLSRNYFVVIFAVSNTSLREIATTLVKSGMKYKEDFIYYSDLFYNQYCEDIKQICLPSHNIYTFALSQTLNSLKNIHTTILGTDLFLQCLEHVRCIEGEIVEVGSYDGGNAYTALQYMSLRGIDKKYNIIDSFEGFPELSHLDPANNKEGDYITSKKFEEIATDFSYFPNAKIEKGFVPNIFSNFKEKQYCLVFFDCDLYQPALDTFRYFWDRIPAGGILLIHDYFAEQSGFTGVRNAVNEFFKNAFKIHEFPYSTIGAIVKK